MDIILTDREKGKLNAIVTAMGCQYLTKNFKCSECPLNRACINPELSFDLAKSVFNHIRKSTVPRGHEKPKPIQTDLLDMLYPKGGD